uniref:DDE-1 domain-containing protein n=1 Tax=Branchiostoma floridae TaxID=7739 RepID=C3YY07_BRAFL|eukprot:XP_002598954.1 hypothetical protein BRAFLDRAFT_79886 [Branchiostoma floridae]
MIINWDQTGRTSSPWVTGHWKRPGPTKGQWTATRTSGSSHCCSRSACPYSSSHPKCCTRERLTHATPASAFQKSGMFTTQHPTGPTRTAWSGTLRLVNTYMAIQRERLGLEGDHPGMAIFDVYKAYRTPRLLVKLKAANIQPLFVPASCTGELQPLDADGSINDALKKDLTQSFSDFYAEKVEAGTSIENVKVDLRLKPQHANWFLGAVDRLVTKPDVIARGWQRTGIRDAIDKVR